MRSNHRLLPTLFCVCLVLLLGGQVLAQSRPATFVAPHFSEEVTFFGVGPPGKLLLRELDLLSQLLRCRRTGKSHAIHPHLAGELLALSQRFRRPVVVVSGYRDVPVHGHPRSFHLSGLAADIMVPEVPLAEVRDFLVARQVKGIGFYPIRGFVHLDVRPRRFWWVDYSDSGELVYDLHGDAPSERQIKASP